MAGTLPLLAPSRPSKIVEFGVYQQSQIQKSYLHLYVSLCIPMSICEYILIIISKCNYPHCHHLCYFETAFCKIGTEPPAKVKASRGQSMWQAGVAQAKDHPKLQTLFLAGFAGVISRVLQSTAKHRWSRQLLHFCEGICERRASSTPTLKSRETITKREFW